MSMERINNDKSSGKTIISKMFIMVEVYTFKLSRRMKLIIETTTRIMFDTKKAK